MWDLSLAIQLILRDYLKGQCYRSHASLSADGPGKTGLETGANNSKHMLKVNNTKKT